MKKKNLILVAMATILLASCAEEQQFGGAVSNSSIALHPTIGKVGTRATETTTANLHAFRAYSFLTDDNVNYMDGVTYSNSSGDWNTSEGSFYWPVKGELNFYCYAPETPGKTGTFAIDPSSQKLTGFAPFPTAATQQDLVYAKATGSLAANATSGLDVDFSHALSEITIAAKNTNTAYTVEVSGVKLGNVTSEGDFTFPSVAGEDASWSLGTERSDYTTEWQNATTLSSTVSSLDASNTAFMLIPQQLAAQAKAIDGNYIALKVKITMQGGQVVHDGWAYVAIPTLWEMNKHYAYTLDFSEGAGQDENGNDIISGSEIKFNVTVTPWDEEGIKLLRSYIRGVNSDNAALKLVINASGTADITPMDNGSWEYDVTDKELTNLTNLFNSNGKITSLDLSHFDTQKATDMTAMFNACSSLRELNLTNFNTHAVTNMYAMFQGCKSLDNIDFSGFNTRNVKKMTAMFQGCISVKSFDLRSFNTCNVTEISYMFQGCSSLETLNLSGWDLSNLSYYSALLEGCNSLKSVNASEWTLPNPTNIQPFLIPTSLLSLENLICRNWKFKGGNSFNDLLNHCRINRADLSGWQTEKITNMGAMCYEATINHLNLSGWNTSNVTNMASAFNQSNIEDLNLTGWNTSKVTDMQYMFQNCQLLQSLDLSHFDMSKVKSTENMFNGCQSLISLNLQGWNLLSESSLIMIFQNCPKLSLLNVANWNAPKVTSIQGMFAGCSSLTSLDLSTWKMPSLETITGMFNNCSKLKNINLSGWNTSKLTTLYGVFSGCSALETIDLSGWNLDKLLNQGGVLQGCTNLKTIYMVGCNETTIEKVKQALTSAGLSTDIVKTAR